MAKALCESRSELRSIDRQTTFKRIERLLQRGFVKGSSRVISGPKGGDEGGHRIVKGSSRDHQGIIKDHQGIIKGSSRDHQRS